MIARAPESAPACALHADRPRACPDGPPAFRSRLAALCDLPDRRDVLVVLALAILLTAVLWRLLAAPPHMAPGLPGEDGATQWLPWREFGFGWMKRGVLPLWNPHLLCGVPFVGGWQSALFYPPNLLYLVLPVPLAARWSVWLHWQLAAVFAFALARSVGAGRAGSAVAALGFTLGAPHMLRLYAGHWGPACAISWLPLIVLCTEKLLTARLRAARGQACLPSTQARHALWFVLGVLAVALQLLAGAPQYVVVSAVAAGLYAVARVALDLPARGDLAAARWRGLLPAGAAWALGGLLAAVQLFPGLSAAASGARSVGLRPEWNLAFSWPPEGLLSLLAPGIFGDGVRAAYWGRYNLWEMTGYVGASVLVLAWCGLRAGRTGPALGAAALPLLALALGEHVGLFGALVRLGGPFAAMRGPAKFLCPLSLFASVLAGLGLTRLGAASNATLRSSASSLRSRSSFGGVGSLRSTRPAAAWRLVGGAGVLAALLMAAGAAVADGGPAWTGLVKALRNATTAQRYPSPDPDPRPAASSAAHGLLWSAGALAGLAGIVAAATSLRGGVRRAEPFIAGLVALELARFAWPYSAASFDASRREGPAGVRLQPADLFSGGRLVLFGCPSPNDPLRYGLDTAEGVEPNPPRWYHQLFCLAVGRPADVAPSIYQAARRERIGAGAYVLQPPKLLLDLAGVEYVIAPAGAPLRLPLVRRSGDHALYRNASALPRAFVVHAAREAGTDRDSLSALSTLDARREVLVPAGSPRPPAFLSPMLVPEARNRGPEAAPDGAACESLGPNQVRVLVRLGSPGWLVLLDAFAPGWRAYGAGGPLPLLRADHAFMAVPLPAGRHVVRLVYRPPAFVAGAWVSAATLLALVGLTAWVVLRRRDGAKPLTPSASPERKRP